MNLVLAFLVLTFLSGVRAARRDRPFRRWPVVVGAALLCLSFLSQRVLQQ